MDHGSRKMTHSISVKHHILSFGHVESLTTTTST